ncbi:MAG: ribosome biogenesis GTPase Der [Candidatus Omnitrophica bacterium]|nr:ribosome biogenesis GTPase Der [Candidatus Omnitrophota bacterium]
MNLPKIVLVGRPNVGKSTLFNRMVGRRKAVVDARPGTTRDWQGQEMRWRHCSFVLVDTGGVLPGGEEKMQRRVAQQVDQILEEAMLVIFVGDCRGGLTAVDETIFQHVRRKNRRIVLAINKADNSREELDVSDFCRLKGFDSSNIFPVSALHGRGIADLLDYVARECSGQRQSFPEKQKQKIPRLAIVGKPNVGKSTLINQLLGKERVIVDETPGTTRDSIEIGFEIKGQPYLLIDTAGIRPMGKIKEVVEIFSIARTKQAILQSDLLVFLIDSSQGVVKDDLRVARLIREAGKPCVIVLNKWDQVKGVSFAEYEKKISARMSDISYAPVLKISALTGMGVSTLFAVAKEVLKMTEEEVSTPKFNKALEEIQKDIRTPRVSFPKPLKFYYGCQVRNDPRTFRVVANFPNAIPGHYKQWLVEQLRRKLSLNYLPIRIQWTGRDKKDNR